jgi:hypothetical protein
LIFTDVWMVMILFLFSSEILILYVVCWTSAPRVCKWALVTVVRTSLVQSLHLVQSP